LSKNKNLDVEKTAELARLEFSQEELLQFVPTFEEILGYFEQLESVDTSGIIPTFHAVLDEDFETPYRLDQTRESLSVSDILSNAPDSRKNQFRVPKVIE
jgi:aspartyl-tRNA(Asn)/glutamyl-tRNA(Gln) amidotransferase subunit C